MMDNMQANKQNRPEKFVYWLLLHQLSNYQWSLQDISWQLSSTFPFVVFLSIKLKPSVCDIGGARRSTLIALIIPSESIWERNQNPDQILFCVKETDVFSLI